MYGHDTVSPLLSSLSQSFHPAKPAFSMHACTARRLMLQVLHRRFPSRVSHKSLHSSSQSPPRLGSGCRPWYIERRRRLQNMTIHLPQDLESSLQTAVHSGHFASMDEAIAEAARLLLRELKLGHLAPPPVRDDNPPDPVLGCMREDAELMDEIVADAYRHRREETWREFDL